jgi:hypothetical protein
MAESRCIICGEKRNGLEVSGDHVMAAIRWFKRNVTRNEKGYRLVVCRDCYLKYKKARDSYQRKQAGYVILGVAITLVFVAFSTNRPMALLVGCVLTAFLYLLSQLSYMPGVILPKAKAEK